MRKIRALTGMIVVGVTYRLAPEHPFPHELDDCVTAYRWVRQHGASLGGDPGRVAVAGDTAGGNVAAAMLLRSRDEDGMTPGSSACVPSGSWWRRLPPTGRTRRSVQLP
jgi:acetyl esterase